MSATIGRVRVSPTDTFRALLLAVTGATVVAGASALWSSRMSPAAFGVLSALSFLGLRGVAALFRPRLEHRRAVEESPLSRLLERYARRVRELDREAEIDHATQELLEVGLGFGRVSLLSPALDEESWSGTAGASGDVPKGPDPRLQSWLLGLDRPFEQSEIDTLAPAELSEALAALLSDHGADVAIPLTSRDELVGLILAGERSAPQKLGAEERAFLGQVKDQAGSALAYVRLKRQAMERVEVAKDVELTAAVQEAFIPAGEVMDFGSIQVAGTYVPASRCGGDWWSVRALDGGRTLVLIGDATGHGISAAMVTAAAKGCADVCLDRLGADVELGTLLDALDAAIRRVGAGSFHMTLFATLIDPESGNVHFANAGHNVPYLCRPRGTKRPELRVLPARGNPLGSGDAPVYERGTRPIAPGDILVLYTDGIVDGHDGDQQPFGDRRMQRKLRQLCAQQPGVAAIRDSLLRASLSFQGVPKPHDDMTAVVLTIGTGTPEAAQTRDDGETSPT